MFVSVGVILLYALPTFNLGGSLTRLLAVDIISAALATVTLGAAVWSYFNVPKKDIEQLAYINYILLTLTVASVVLMTGATASPLLGLWIAVCVFAGVFGWRGFALILLLIVSYAAYELLSGASTEPMVIAGAATLVPLLASYILWHTKSSKDLEHSKAYSELATELSHEANKSETVISAINDGVVSVDKQGVIQLINPAAQRIIGWGQNDAVGLSYKSVVKLLDSADKPITPANDPVEKVLATSQDVHSEDFSVETEAGKKVLLSIIVSPVGTPSTGAIMVFRDMTKEKAEERDQVEFISTASHEMRTPVASIEGYLGLALNPATATIDAKARDYIQKAQASAQHLGRLFQDLLDVSKAEDGRMTNNPKVVDVVEFAGMVTDGLKTKAIEKGLRFMYKPIPNEDTNERQLGPVYYANVDSDHLREVVANLVENAIKYTPAGDVIVDVTGDDTHVTVSIQDSGIGIPAEDIPHLFQKFYRVDNSDTREIGGTGLGLFLCRRLAEIMGGQIRVESEYKKGSTFFLDLPRIDHMEAQRLMEISMAAAQLAESERPTPAPAPVAPVSLNDLPPTFQAQPILTTLEPVHAEVAQTMPSVRTVPTQQPQAVPTQQPTRPVTPRTPNVPLSQLEQNPSAYISQRPSAQIPDRQQPESRRQP